MKFIIKSFLTLSVLMYVCGHPIDEHKDITPEEIFSTESEKPEDHHSKAHHTHHPHETTLNDEAKVKAIVPLLDGMLRGYEVMLDDGKRNLKSLTGMIILLDQAPQLQLLINEMTEAVDSIGQRIQDMTNTVHKGEKADEALSKCFAEDQEILQNLEKQVARDVKQVIDEQRDTLNELLAAGKTMRDELKNMELIEKKVLAVATPEKALQLGSRVRQAAEGEAKSIERTFTSASTKFRQSIRKSVDSLTLARQNVEVNAKRILKHLQTCAAQHQDYEENAAQPIIAEASVN